MVGTHGSRPQGDRVQVRECPPWSTRLRATRPKPSVAQGHRPLRGLERPMGVPHPDRDRRPAATVGCDVPDMHAGADRAWGPVDPGRCDLPSAGYGRRDRRPGHPGVWGRALRTSSSPSFGTRWASMCHGLMQTESRAHRSHCRRHLKSRPWSARRDRDDGWIDHRRSTRGAPVDRIELRDRYNARRAIMAFHRLSRRRMVSTRWPSDSRDRSGSSSSALLRVGSPANAHRGDPAGGERSDLGDSLPTL